MFSINTRRSHKGDSGCGTSDVLTNNLITLRDRDTSINIRMYAPGAVLALCLCCILSGNVFGYEYGEDYQDSYYNSISNGEPGMYVFVNSL